MVVLFFKGNKEMRKMYIIMSILLIEFNVNSQSLLQDIENKYAKLDSINYIENIKLSYKNKLDKVRTETLHLLKEISFKNKLNSNMTKLKTTIPNYLNKQDSNEDNLENKNISEFNSELSRYKSPVYVLNLVLKKNERNYCYELQVDSNKLCFNLFYFGRNYKKGLYVFVEDGQYNWHSEYYSTFSTVFAENVPNAFKKILLLKPKYLLLCSQFEGMNTILYVLNGQIYVYRIVENETYELKKYMCIKQNRILSHRIY